MSFIAGAATIVVGIASLHDMYYHNSSLSSSVSRSEQVFQNTIHVIIAGVVSTWWFAPDEASSCCSKAIKDSFVRATTTSFGSICFGSLLVAIIQTLRSMVESARHNDDNGACGSIMLCLVDCCLSCVEGMLEYFNKYAYIYVGMVSAYVCVLRSLFPSFYLSYTLTFLSHSTDTVTLKLERTS